MYSDSNLMMQFIVIVTLFATSQAFFLKWGSDSRTTAAQKSWVQPYPQNLQPAFRYSNTPIQYSYNPYETRKMYQMAPQPYSQPDMMQQNMAPIPISVPAGAALTPVSLQHVQLVPCMCPVAPEEADKLQESVGPGPYLAQTYAPASYSVPQQLAASSDSAKSGTKQ